MLTHHDQTILRISVAFFFLSGATHRSHYVIRRNRRRREEERVSSYTMMHTHRPSGRADNTGLEDKELRAELAPNMHIA